MAIAIVNDILIERIDCYHRQRDHSKTVIAATTSGT